MRVFFRMIIQNCTHSQVPLRLTTLMRMIFFDKK
jgi:hypothetical protein